MEQLCTRQRIALVSACAPSGFPTRCLRASPSWSTKPGSSQCSMCQAVRNVTKILCREQNARTYPYRFFAAASGNRLFFPCEDCTDRCCAHRSQDAGRLTAICACIAVDSRRDCSTCTCLLGRSVCNAVCAVGRESYHATSINFLVFHPIL